MSTKHQLQRLLPRHYAIVDLVLEGYGPKEIAQAMEMSEVGIQTIMASPNFQHEVARRRQKREFVVDQTLASTVTEARDKIDSMAKRAADRLEELMDSDDERVALMSTKDILDRAFGAGGSAKPVTNVNLESGQVVLLVQALQESREGRRTVASDTPAVGVE